MLCYGGRVSIGLQQVALDDLLCTLVVGLHVAGPSHTIAHLVASKFHTTVIGRWVNHHCPKSSLDVALDIVLSNFDPKKLWFDTF